MCMTIKHPQSRIQRLPKEFTAYKVVARRNGKYYPPIMDTLSAIEQHNVARTTQVREPVGDGRGTYYRPYYHSFKTQAACDAAQAVISQHHWKFIKIRIKRKDVTCVGGYGPLGGTRYLTIISKEYSTDFEEYIPTNGRKNSE